MGMNELFFSRLLDVVVDVERRKEDEDVDEPKREQNSIDVTIILCFARPSFTGEIG